ncbi:MAG TPA: class I SAM-dependent methyltransferase [Candidatus Binatia bacterium]|nr:class I SAM-dependent methyltransferase [Candidatus Binatia bacterium]
MNLQEVQNNWDEFGRRDPFWAILTHAQFKNNRWDPAAFFETGRREVEILLRHLQEIGVPFSCRRALDFGCGAGRLSQALCAWFHCVAGVDIAPSMIALANQYNTFGTRCRYLLNPAQDLRVLGAQRFDFVLSLIVLQHLRPEYSKHFIREFIRVLAPAGIAVFQIPSRPSRPPAARPPVAELPWAACRADLSLLRPVGLVHAGEAFEVSVRVRNRSGLAWPCSGRSDGHGLVQLGNHWRNEDGTLLAADDARALLPFDLAAGAHVDLTLSVNAPDSQGTYFLELDMVEEGIAWFADRGSQLLCQKVQVAASDRERAPRGFPVMEMHGVPKEEIYRVVAQSGGRVLNATQDQSAGGWESFLYTVAKA